MFRTSTVRNEDVRMFRGSTVRSEDVRMFRTSMVRKGVRMLRKSTVRNEGTNNEGVLIILLCFFVSKGNLYTFYLTLLQLLLSARVEAVNYLPATSSQCRFYIYFPWDR